MPSSESEPAECVHRGTWNKLVQNLTLNHLNCVYKLSQKIRPKYSFYTPSQAKSHKKMEFQVQKIFSISKNLNFYLKFQTHTDQCDREYRTRHQIQGKIRNSLPLIPKKSQKSSGGVELTRQITGML